jgi:hypothetical protein
MPRAGSAALPRRRVDIAVVPAAVQLPAPLVVVYKGHQSGEGVRHGGGLPGSVG